MLNYIGEVIRLAICIVFAWWLCDINSAEHYEWLSGIWHGVMFVPNWLRGAFCDGVLYKAVDYSTGYNIAWWIFCVVSCLGAIVGWFFGSSWLFDDDDF